MGFGLAARYIDLYPLDPETQELLKSLSRDRNPEGNVYSDSRKIWGRLVKTVGPEDVGVENVQISFGLDGLVCGTNER